MGDADDRYVTGDVNWESYTLQQLVTMVADQADVAQLQRLAQDWRDTGDAVMDTADYLADALADLMDFWEGQAAEQARTRVARNAQWVSDLGQTARRIGDPIDEAAGALKAAKEAMPELPAPAPSVADASAPAGAEGAAAVSGPVGAAVGGAVAGSTSGFSAALEEAALKREAVETMRRFESAVVGIDRSTPQFAGPSTTLRPRRDPEPEPGVDLSLTTVSFATSTDLRWQLLTGELDPRTAAQSQGGGAGDRMGDKGFLAGQPGHGPVGGRAAGATAGVEEPARAARGLGVPSPGSAAAAAAAAEPAGMGAGPMGMGAAGAGGGSEQDHRRRYPFDAEDPFALDQKASPPVIGH